MKKIFLACIAATMVLSASAFATGLVTMGSIGQTQGFSIYGENIATQVGINTTTNAGNMATVEQNNNLTELCGSKLTQNENSVLIQGTNASGSCGSLDVQQIGGSSGTQTQLVSTLGHTSLATQNQTLGAGLQQSLNIAGSNGTGTSVQSSVADQCQTILNGNTIMNSSQTIGTVQTGSVSGSGWSGGSAGGLIDVTATQSQMAN